MHREIKRLDRRFAWVALCGLLAFICPALVVKAAPVAEAETSRTARNNAVSAVPFDKLKSAAQAKLKDILKRPSLYRRLPTQRIVCDAEMHLFLLRHPEVIVNMWTMMGITNLDVDRIAPYQVRAADGKGTQCDVELIYGTPNLHVAYGVGTYEGPVFRRKITARCVCVIRTEYEQNDQQEVVVTNTLDVFLQFDGLAAELLGKTIQPLITNAADHNFAEAMNFIERVNEAAENNGPGVERLSKRMRKVDAQTRQKFAKVANIVHQRALMRQVAPQLTTQPNSSAVHSARNTGN